MERVVSYPSPSQNHATLLNHSVRNVQGSSSVHSRFVGHGGVVVFRVEDIPEESRDDPQLASHRWNTDVRWKQAFDEASEEVYQRSLREVPRSNGPIDPSRRHPLHRHWHHDHRWYPGRDHYSAAPYSSHESRSLTTGGMVPITASRHEARRRHHRAVAQEFVSSEFTDTAVIASSQPHDHPDNGKPATIIRNIRRTHVTSRHHPGTRNTSIVVIPDSIVIPNEMAPPPESSSIGADTTSPAEQSLAEQQHSNDWSDDAASPRQAKRTKIWENDRLEGKFDKLDLLCSATLELGPLQDNPTGCSCPKSKCIALYCDCFKAGRRCNPNTCTCLNCKNTIAESGPNGARSKAIQSILARNPRAFTNAGNNPMANKLAPGEQGCNCIRSRCLKLYCTCFQVGKACNPDTCTCVSCLNTHQDPDGHRKAAIEATLEKRPDAFVKAKVKEIGSGCACKNNRCIRKYCECFRTKLACTKKCSCRDCGNQEPHEEPNEEPRDASLEAADMTDV